MYGTDNKPLEQEEITNRTVVTRNTSAPTLPGYRRYVQPVITLTSKFPRLFVLDRMVSHVQQQSNQIPSLKDVAFIGVQHLLKTTGSLFNALIELGAQPENMFFTGKCYSTDPEVVIDLKALGLNILPGSKPKLVGDFEKTHHQDVKELWQMLIEHCEKVSVKKIIIISDGPALIENAPNLDIAMAAIEQTRHGRYSKGEEESLFPIVNVAQSAAKQLIEPLFIQKAAMNRLRTMIATIDKGKMTIGIAGYGAIGKALLKYLLENGYKVLIYDKDANAMASLPNTKNLEKATSLQNLLVNSDYTFGCTGQDITEEVDLLSINGRDRTLISLSSGDVEFNSLIRQIPQLSQGKKGSLIVDPLKDNGIETTKGSNIYIKKTGFPINFDRAETPDPEEQFSLTRGLLLGGILQALLLDKWNTKFRNIMLSPYVQRAVVSLWNESVGVLKDDPEVKQLPTTSFINPKWIAANSTGECLSDQQDVFFIVPCSSKSGNRAKY